MYNLFKFSEVFLMTLNCILQVIGIIILFKNGNPIYSFIFKIGEVGHDNECRSNGSNSCGLLTK